MRGFLDEVASLLLKHDLAQQVVIVPSERAGHALKLGIGKQVGISTRLPAIFTMSSWIESLHSARKLDETEIVLVLHQAVSGVNPNVAFEEFLSWSGDLLSDFNAVWQSMRDPNQVFINLRDAKELEGWEPIEWSYDLPNQGMIQKQFETFWSELPAYFEAFENRLNELNLCTAAKASADMARSADLLSNTGNLTYWFVGLNSVNPAEEQIIRRFLNRGNGKVVWDADSFYIHKEHDAGWFLYKNMQSMGAGEILPGSYFTGIQKEIEIIGAAGNQLQCETVADLLKEMPEEDQNETLVVAADEKLAPMLYGALPQDEINFNFSLGFPLRSTPEWSLFDLILQAYNDAILSGTYPVFYAKHINDLLKHPLMPDYVRSKQFTGRFAYIKADTANTNLPKAFELSEIAASNSSMLLKTLLSICESVDNEIKDSISGAAWQMIAEMVRSLIVVRQRHLGDYPVSFWIQQIRKKATSLSLNVKGERENGVQIMGVLESRLLSFKNVIFISLNEGVMPASQNASGFIPFDLRKHFGMPVTKDRENIYAYNFYRLIQRAEKVWLVWNSNENEQLGTTEASRYIKQLEHELGEATNVQFSRQARGNKIEPFDSRINEVAKSNFVLQQLDLLCKSGFSASALNKYLICPVNFYLEYILGLKEPKDPEEMGHDTFGTLVHTALEELYKPVVGEQLTVAHIKKMKPRIDSILEGIFRKEFGVSGAIKGKHYLNLQVAAKYVERALDSELKSLYDARKIRLISLEDNLSVELTIPTPNGVKAVKLKGKIDRIDEFDGVLRIVDYKTGSVKGPDLKVGDMGELIQSAQHQKQLQLMLYALLYLDNFSEYDQVQSGILSIRNASAGVQVLRLGDKGIISRDESNIFRQEIIKLIAEILHPEVPFVRNPTPAFGTTF